MRISGDIWVYELKSLTIQNNLQILLKSEKTLPVTTSTTTLLQHRFQYHNLHNQGIALANLRRYLEKLRMNINP